ncbi:hypothetical protein CPB85DRAFT_375999 [Mucidula mucida]|nr:hypothetical protein CPB85DRAFT_375999 [Mucidula mucida]
MREDSSTVSPSEDDPAAAGSLREPCVDSSLESGPDSVPSAAAPEVEGAQLKAESPDTQAEQEVGPFTSFLVSQLLKQEEAPLCVNPADLTLSEEKKDNSGRENSVEAYYESFLNLSWELEDIPPPGPSEEYDGPFPVPPGGDAESYDGPFPLPPGTE